MNADPEKLNLWDRFFNRYRKVIKGEGLETWKRREYWESGYNTKFNRNFVEYYIIDRLTGSVTIKKEYLN